LSVFVKICGLRNREQVDAAINARADALGFVFAESLRRVSPQEASVIAMDIPPHVKRVAVMLHPTNEEWQQVLRHFVPDVLQCDAQDVASLDVPDGVECWPVFREGKSLRQPLNTYVYEGQKSGQGETVDWSNAASIASEGNMILAGGLCSGNIAAAIATVRPFGVDVSSGVESAPGQKDIQLITEFLVAAKAAEKNL